MDRKVSTDNTVKSIVLRATQSNAQNSLSMASTVCELRTSRCPSWIWKGKRTQIANCWHLLDHRKSKQMPEKNIYFSFIDYIKALDCVDHNKLWKILQEREVPDHLTGLLKKPVCRFQEATLESDVEQWTGLKFGRWYIKVVYFHTAYLCRVDHAKCQAGWITSWNQDCKEKYQQPQICSWYPSNGRKQRGTKEFLSEGGRGELKSLFKIQHSKN